MTTQKKALYNYNTFKFPNTFLRLISFRVKGITKESENKTKERKEERKKKEEENIERKHGDDDMI